LSLCFSNTDNWKQAFSGKMITGIRYFTVWYIYQKNSGFSMDSSYHGENSSLVSDAMDILSVCGNALKQSEPLGSVTHNQEVTGSSTSMQIRSSARVSKKMRLDSIGTPVTSVVPDKKGALQSSSLYYIKQLTG
jgi:hypothetical protein